jgi:hypothetical protein
LQSPIVVNRVRYSVLKLFEDRGNLAFLMRSQDGELFGVYRRKARMDAVGSVTREMSRSCRSLHKSARRTPDPRSAKSR